MKSIHAIGRTSALTTSRNEIRVIMQYSKTLRRERLEKKRVALSSSVASALRRKDFTVMQRKAKALCDINIELRRLK